MSANRRVLLAIPLLLLSATQARAWPSETMRAIGRDACRLLPASLARLLTARETELQRQAASLPPELAQALARDLAAGTLQPDALALVDGEVDGVVALLRQGHVSEGLVRFGVLLRVAADLSDPLLAAGPEGWPPGLEREYYALFAANQARMPVVLDDPNALRLSRRQLGPLLQALARRSHEQAPTIRAELVRAGRVVSHRVLDFRSPAWAVSSLAYSRAVTATAAAWLVVWRGAHGDTTRMRQAQEVEPREAPATPGAGVPVSAEPPGAAVPPEPSLVNEPRSLPPEAP